MRFGFRCAFAGGHEAVETFRIGQAPDFAPCSEHGLMSPRIFEAPMFQEDRRGMRTVPRGAPTEDWSWTLGGPRPRSRAEMRAIEKAQGIEFLTPAEARADVERLRSGKNLDEPAKPEKGYLAREIAKRGIRFDRSLSAPRALTREESERKLAAERGWTASADAEAKTVNPAKQPG